MVDGGENAAELGPFSVLLIWLAVDARHAFLILVEPSKSSASRARVFALPNKVSLARSITGVVGLHKVRVWLAVQEFHALEVRNVLTLENSTRVAVVHAVDFKLLQTAAGGSLHNTCKHFNLKLIIFI